MFNKKLYVLRNAFFINTNTINAEGRDLNLLSFNEYEDEYEISANGMTLYFDKVVPKIFENDETIDYIFEYNQNESLEIIFFK